MSEPSIIYSSNKFRKQKSMECASNAFATCLERLLAIKKGVVFTFNANELDDATRKFHGIEEGVGISPYKIAEYINKDRLLGPRCSVVVKRIPLSDLKNRLFSDGPIILSINSASKKISAKTKQATYSDYGKDPKKTHAVVTFEYSAEKGWGVNDSQYDYIYYIKEVDIFRLYRGAYSITLV